MAKTIRWAFNTRLFSQSAENWKICLSSVQSEEVERLSEFVYKNSVLSSLVGRLLLRRWATKCLHLQWKEVIFKRSERGRPFLVWPTNVAQRNVDVNVSHQGDWVVLASCEGGIIGTDVMKMQYTGGKITSEFFRLMTRQFTPNEWQTIKRDPDELIQLESFFRHWCLKESVVKALGVGITFDLQKVSFCINSPTLLTNTARQHIVCDTTVDIYEERDRRWQFAETVLDGESCAAVAFLPAANSASGSQERLHLLSPENSASNESFAPERSAETNNCLFQQLTMSELIDGAQEITPVSDDLIDKFILKETASWL